jgi:threonine/homoserine/homoserine lactone efflux protein
VLGPFLVGVALGAGSSVVPGPCGLAVVAAAARHGRARAVATSFGAGLGDATYAGLGILGVGRALAGHPALVQALHAVSGLILIAYATHTLRAQRAETAPSSDTPGGGVWRGIPIGYMVLLANPAALVTWVFLVGASWGGAPAASPLAVIVGIAAGTTAWFGGLGLLVEHGAHARRDALRSLTRVVCVLLIVYGGSLLVRAVGVSG